MAEMLTFDIDVPGPGFRLQAAASLPLDGITAVSGPSGAGKTTLLRALAGLVPEAAGAVRAGGSDWTSLPAESRRIGFVFQEPRLFPHLDVAANIGFGARRRATPQADLDRIVGLLGLAPMLRRRPSTLSGGEARRVSLARALASGPRVLFLDEPMTGLDRPARDEVLAMIADATRRLRLPALLVSHDPAEIGAVADRVLRMDRGRIAGLDGRPPRLTAIETPGAQGQAELRIGDQCLPLPHGARPAGEGRHWHLPLLTGRFLLSQADPGPSSAHSVLSAVLSPGQDSAVLAIGEQSLILPRVAGGYPPFGPVSLVLMDGWGLSFAGNDGHTDR